MASPTPFRRFGQELYRRISAGESGTDEWNGEREGEERVYFHARGRERVRLWPRIWGGFRIRNVCWDVYGQRVEREWHVAGLGDDARESPLAATTTQEEVDQPIERGHGRRWKWERGEQKQYPRIFWDEQRVVSQTIA